MTWVRSVLGDEAFDAYKADAEATRLRRNVDTAVAQAEVDHAGALDRRAQSLLNAVAPAIDSTQNDLLDARAASILGSVGQAQRDVLAQHVTNSIVPAPAQEPPEPPVNRMVQGALSGIGHGLQRAATLPGELFETAAGFGPSGADLPQQALATAGLAGVVAAPVASAVAPVVGAGVAGVAGKTAGTIAEIGAGLAGGAGGLAKLPKLLRGAEEAAQVGAQEAPAIGRAAEALAPSWRSVQARFRSILPDAEALGVKRDEIQRAAALAQQAPTPQEAHAVLDTFERGLDDLYRAQHEAGKYVSDVEMRQTAVDIASGRRLPAGGYGKLTLEPLAPEAAAPAPAVAQPTVVEAAAPAAARAARRPLRQAVEATAGTFGKGALLSSPLTHARNIVSTGASALLQPVERAVASLTQPVAEALGATKGEARTLAGAGAMAKSYPGNVPAAVREAVRALREGAPATEEALTGTAPAAAPNVLERAGRVALRAATAEDVFWKTLVGRAEEAAGATPETAKSRAAYLTYNAGLDTFGRWLAQVQKVPVAGGLLLPFFKTAYSAVKRDVELSPLGWLSVGYAASKGKDSAELADRSARALLGTTLFASVLKYGLEEDAQGRPNITGAWPDTPRERDRWTALGIAPNSIRLGDSYYSFAYLPMLNSNLSMIGALAQEARDRDLKPDRGYEESAARVAGAFLEAQFQKPLLGNLAELVGAISDPDRAASFVRRLGTTAGGMAIPASGALSWAAGVEEPYVRERPTSLGQQVAQRIPRFLRERVGLQPPPVQTRYRRPVEKTGGPVERAISPIRRQAVTGR